MRCFGLDANRRPWNGPERLDGLDERPFGNHKSVKKGSIHSSPARRSERIIREAHKASAFEPLLVVVGGPDDNRCERCIDGPWNCAKDGRVRTFGQFLRVQR